MIYLFSLYIPQDDSVPQTSLSLKESLLCMPETQLTLDSGFKVPKILIQGIKQGHNFAWNYLWGPNLREYAIQYKCSGEAFCEVWAGIAAETFRASMLAL